MSLTEKDFLVSEARLALDLAAPHDLTPAPPGHAPPLDVVATPTADGVT